MKFPPKGEHFVDRLDRCDAHVLIGRFANFLFWWQIPKPSRHPLERFVRLEEAPCLGIDQRNAARHVGQDFVVKSDFALDARGRFSLSLVKLSGQPGNDSRRDNQPRREHSHSFEQIADRPVGD